MIRSRQLEASIGFGLLLAAAGAAGTLLSDPPYLSGSGLNPWVVAWALAVFGLLFQLPFALIRLVGRRVPEREKRLELAVIYWGAAALVGAIVAAAVWATAGLGTESAAAALALTALVDCGLVVVAVGGLVLLNG